ncbi:TIGR03943 family putative permease subunit, partial [Nodularia sphaerocarpa]
PEERSLVDWARTLNVYPEPDSYIGQDAKVQGFVIHPPDIGEEYIFLARFVLTCCAADAYPVGLPVKLPENQKRYPPDTWLEVEGKMITETLAGKRNLTIAATSIKEIPQPRNPYSY